MAEALTPSDKERLTEITESLRDEHGWAHFVTLDWLLRDWSTLVARIEGGYDTSIEEYDNDLDTRRLLDVVQMAAPSDIARRLAATLDPWDERFTAATRRARGPVSGAPTVWHWRVPRNLGPELKDALEHYGLI